VSVSYATADDTAEADSDYTSVSGTLAFAPGEWQKTIWVPTLDDAAGELTETFTVNLSNVVGAAIADSQGVGTIIDDEVPPTKFYVVDDASQNRTFEYGVGFGLTESYGLNSGNSAPRGVTTTIAGDKTWVIDANRNVYVYNTSGGLLGSWTAGTLANNAIPEGIATNGADVWIVDGRSDKVYRYSGAASLLTGSVNATSFNLASGNTNPKDIVTDGASLWVVDDAGKNDKVFKYTLTGGLSGSWTIDPANKAPTGITIDPANVEHIWIVDSGTDRVYQYNGAATKTSGSLLASATFALATGNTNPQGIADPPASLEAVEAQPIANALPPSSNANSRQLAPKPRTRFSTDSQPPSAESLNLLVPTNVAHRSIGMGKQWRGHELFTDAEAVDAALEEMDYSAWPELLAEI
jgi:hypothetical protein